MPRPEHLFCGTSCEGGLYDTRVANWSHKAPLRKNFQYTHVTMTTLADVKATLRNGEFAWPGGYQMYLITRDGGALSFATVRKEWRQIVWDYLHDASTGWRVEACAINYEDSALVDDETGEPIPAAYGKD